MIIMHNMHHKYNTGYETCSVLNKGTVYSAVQRNSTSAVFTAFQYGAILFWRTGYENFNNGSSLCIQLDDNLSTHDDLPLSGRKDKLNGTVPL